MYKRKNVKKSSISLLKGYRGSIADDGPSPSNQTRIFTRRRNDGHQGIRIMRNRRGEFVITELNPEILLQQIGENNCSVGQVVEFINDQNIMGLTTPEVNRLLRVQRLISIRTREEDSRVQRNNVSATRPRPTSRLSVVPQEWDYNL